MRIAIVNDLSMAVSVLKNIIESSSHQVAWVAEDGAEAVKKCAADLPDLVLMDMLMPVMNGVESTRQIMANTPCPILVVTVSVSENSSMVFEAMGAGALDAVSTPVVGPTGEAEGKEEFLLKLKRIERLLNLTPTTRTSSAQAKSNDCGKRLIAIGSSTGGPNAVAEVLKAFPKGYPAAFVVVQHVDAAFAKGFADWLNTQTELDVKIAEGGEVLKCGTVYVAGTNNHMMYSRDGKLQYTDDYQEIVYRPSVDVFFNSLVENYQGKMVAALLTGMGRDGAQGLLSLHKKGVYTIAQDKETCAVYGMPKAAAELGAADEILPIKNVAQAIIRKIERLK